MAPTLFISITTFTSPTALAVKDPPNLLVMSGSARVEDKFETVGPIFFESIKSAHATRVYSSPNDLPFSSTNTNRSTSGSTAIPKSALFITTASQRSLKFSSKGSGL